MCKYMTPETAENLGLLPVAVQYMETPDSRVNKKVVELMALAIYVMKTYTL